MPASSAKRSFSGQRKQGTAPSATFSEISRHPLVILLLGTIVGSIIIPYISGRSARSKEIEELRLRTALAAVQSNNDVDRTLNIMLTSFETFWKDTDEASRENNKPELRKKIYELYEHFDRASWWWLDESRQQAKLLGILSKKEAKEAEAISIRYGTNLKESAAVIESVWKISLRQSTANSRDAAKVLRSARKNLEAARIARYQLLEEFTGLLCKQRR